MKRSLLLIPLLALVSCDPPGKPTLADKWKSPADVTGFTQLYAQNCVACHGDGKSIAGSITLKNPLYLAIVPEEKLRDVIANGVPGYNMPAFAKENGGSLSDEQIDTIVKGLMAWKDASKLPAAPLPPYSAQQNTPPIAKDTEDNSWQVIINLTHKAEKGVTSIEVDKKEYATPTEIVPILKNKVAANPLVWILIRADREVQYDSIRQILEVIKQTGAANVNFSIVDKDANALGDVAAGKAAFGQSCASCHGADGSGGKAGSVVDRDYLNLVSNQYLRTVTIAGRPELGCPDFAHRTPGSPMSPAAISDITAWLVSQRRNEFNQPITPAPAKK
jgi:mono/diheme cytochrome c family protein